MIKIIVLVTAIAAVSAKSVISTRDVQLSPADFTCPVDDCLATGCLYQWNADCTKFVDCGLVTGQVWLRDCASNLEFNANIHVCDYAPSPTCKKTEETPTPTTAEPTTAEPTTAEPTTAEPTTAEPTDAPTTEAPAEEEPIAPTDGPTTQGPTTEAPTEPPTTEAPAEDNPPSGSFTCPANDNCVVTGCLWQDHNDPTCRGFYQCDAWGNLAGRHQCGTGTVFDEKYRVCVNPPSSTCRQTGEPEPTTSAPTTPEPTEGPTTEGPTTEGTTTDGPVNPDEEPTTTEGPTTEGPTTEGPTTEGPTTEGPTTEGPTTEGPTTEGPTTEGPTTAAPTDPPTTAAPTQPPTTAAPTQPPAEEEPIAPPSGTFKCPPGDLCLVTGCLWQNVNDCTKFWQCDLQLVAYEKTCPEGTEFNEKVRVCVHKPSPNCGQTSLPQQ